MEVSGFSLTTGLAGTCHDDLVTPTTVLLVDDHPVFRASARAELEDGGFDVVGELATAAGVVASARRLRPDVVLLDIRLPDGDGIELARELADAVPERTVVLISSLAAGDYGERLLSAAGGGFLHKSELSGPTLRAVLGRASPQPSPRPGCCRGGDAGKRH
jgi:DNA-binding NarL/FixJ family response regulator